MKKPSKTRKTVKVSDKPKAPRSPEFSKAQRDEAKFALSDKVDETLRKMKLDPITELAMYAKGDVVGLGLMSQEELDADAEFNADGAKVRRSGHEIALDLIPPSQRQKAAAELLSYHFPRKKERELGGEGDEMAVHLYLPDNGRGKANS